jgi:hypothetical protein
MTDEPFMRKAQTGPGKTIEPAGAIEPLTNAEMDQLMRERAEVDELERAAAPQQAARASESNGAGGVDAARPDIAPVPSFLIPPGALAPVGS